MWDSMKIEGTEYPFLCFCRKYTMEKTQPNPNQTNQTNQKTDQKKQVS